MIEWLHNISCNMNRIRAMSNQEAIARLHWTEPSTNRRREFLLVEGATATIGRSSNNDIQIAEHHVSRQHAVVSYRDGIFMINDLGSSNGTFVNDQPVQDPFPLFAGDKIRLYVPIIEFAAVITGEYFEEDSTVIEATNPDGQGTLTVTNGPQEGQTIPLLLHQVTIGRATSTASWEILLQDPSVSRPHAQLHKKESEWFIVDLGSSNGTRINNKTLNANTETKLQDGDKIELGGSILLFRTGWESPKGNNSTDSETKSTQ